MSTVPTTFDNELAKFQRRVVRFHQLLTLNTPASIMRGEKKLITTAVDHLVRFHEQGQRLGPPDVIARIGPKGLETPHAPTTGH